jgi:hypothetical protein
VFHDPFSFCMDHLGVIAAGSCHVRRLVKPPIFPTTIPTFTLVADTRHHDG